MMNVDVIDKKNQINKINILNKICWLTKKKLSKILE